MLNEAQVGIKIARRNTNNLRYADDTTLMAENEEKHHLLVSQNIQLTADFPGGPGVNPTANARGRWVGCLSCELDFPHATGQLTPRATTTEADEPESLCSTTREAAAMRSQLTETREGPPAATKTPRSQK